MNTFIKSLDPHKTVQRVFYASAVLWVIFGLYSLVRLGSGTTQQAEAARLVAVFMFINAAAMVAAGFGLGRKNRVAYFFGLMVLAVNILVTISAQISLLDLIPLTFDAVLLGIMIALRTEYF